MTGVPPSDDVVRARATSWRHQPLERVPYEEIDRLATSNLDQLIALFEQFLGENNPATKKMMVAARLRHATAQRTL